MLNFMGYIANKTMRPKQDWSSSGRITALHAVHAGSIPVQSMARLV